MPFMVSMWLHAIFVNPRTSVVLGSIYVVFRYFSMAVFYKYFAESDMHTDINAVWPGLMPLKMLGCGILTMVIFMGLGSIGAKVIQKGVAWDKNIYEEETDDEESS